MRRFAPYGLILFFVLLYTQGLWLRVGVPRLLLEGPLMALPVAILLSQRGASRTPAPGFLFIWFYLGWSLAACIYNDEGVLRGLLYARYLIASYLVFWIVWSSCFTQRQLLWINGVILTLFFVQVAAALFYLLVLHQQIEHVVGTMGYHSGALATVFPMFAFSYLLAFFLYYNRPLLLIAGFSFFLVGYASRKLGIYYLIPLMLVLGAVLYAFAEGVPNAMRRSAAILMIAVCGLPFVVSLLFHTQRIETRSVQKEVGLYNKLAAFLDASSAQRTDQESRSWYTTTRVGTSKRVIEETLHRGPLVFLFGRGPRVCLSESGQSGEAVSRYGIIYGLVGWSQDALAIGWPAMFAHSGFYTYLFCLLLRKRGGMRDPYWKAMRLTVQLGFFVFLISYLLYSTNFTTGGWLSSVYLYLLAVLLAPQYQKVLCFHSTVSPRPTLRGTPRRAWHEGPCRSSLPRPTFF